MTTVSKSVWTDVEVDVDIDLGDVLEFIDDADERELEKLRSVLKVGPEILSQGFDAETVMYLIDQANRFGISDMLNQIKNEGERIGVYLKPAISEVQFNA